MLVSAAAAPDANSRPAKIPVIADRPAVRTPIALDPLVVVCAPGYAAWPWRKFNLYSAKNMPFQRARY
jgi:hypothetical protein